MTGASDDAAWPAVDGRTTLRELSHRCVVVAPAGSAGGSRLLVLTIVARDESADVRYGWLGAPQRPMTRQARADMQLEEFVSRWPGIQLGAASIAPGVDWAARRPAWVWALPVPALLLFAFAVVTGTALAWSFVPFAIALTWYVIGRAGATRQTEIPGPDGKTLAITDVYRRAHSGALGAERAEAATDRVDAVKETYGALREDVVYRIENSALFDTTVPQTREFHVALMGWDDSAATLSPGEQARLAAEIQVRFDTARAHAETLGLHHLPATARAVAQRAAGSLRLAQRSQSDGERAAALESAARLLSSLALYYLPDPQVVRELAPPRTGHGADPGQSVDDGPSR